MQNARFFCLQKKLVLVHFNLSILSSLKAVLMAELLMLCECFNDFKT